VSYEQFVDLLKDQVQIAALSFMALMYAIKIWQLMKLKPIVDRTPKRGDPNAGMRYSFALVAMPWQMNSYQKHPLKYVEFAIFHLGIAAAIFTTFLIPYVPRLVVVPVIMYPCLVLIALGFLCALSRLLRRIGSPAMRMVSSADDYFSILLLAGYLFFAFLAIPHSVASPHHWTIVVFFLLTAFFLIYVPFSKISHYILWPFNRYYVGKHFGKRGVYPKQPGTIHPAGA
jgi:hypothetical protein